MFGSLTEPEKCDSLETKCQEFKDLSFYKVCQSKMGPAFENFHFSSCQSSLKDKCSLDVVCEIVKDFVKECIEAGVEISKVENWRKSLGCCKLKKNFP